MLPTCVSRRTCYSLQPRLCGQKTSPCVRTRWPRILERSKKKKRVSETEPCTRWFVLSVEAFGIAQTDVGCSPACVSPTQSFTGGCQSFGITNNGNRQLAEMLLSYSSMQQCKMHSGWHLFSLIFIRRSTFSCLLP